MKSIIAWWVRNTVAANLLMISILVGGVVAYFKMEREAFPAIALSGAEVSVSWPGASPEDVEQQLVIRFEEALTGIDGVKKMTSGASEGSGSVTLEANPGVDMTRFMEEVKTRVDSVNNLPPSSYRPTVQRLVGRPWYMGVAVYGDISPRDMKRIAKSIREDIARLPGGELALLDGVLNEEVSIELSEEAMRRYKLSFSEVAEAITSVSLNRSAGTVRTPSSQVQLRARNLADTARDFEDIVIRQTADGNVLHLRDIARVTDGVEDVDQKFLYEGQPVALIGIRTTDKMDIVKTSKAIKKYIKTAENQYPGVSLALWWDQSKIFNDRMQMISSNALLGLVLVLIVLMLFLRPVVAFWVSVGIATAFAGALIFLPTLGVSLNMVSLFAFLIVIGIVVDDAIVVGENIHNHVEHGDESEKAAILGTQLVAKPVIFAVITTMIAFAPWMLLSGESVQITRQISWVVICALSFSLIESLFILPAHLNHLKPQTYDGFLGPFLRFQNRIAQALVQFAKKIYRPFVVLAIRARYTTVALFIGVFILAFALVKAGWLPFRFMPEVEDEQIQVTISMPDGTPYARTLAVHDHLNRAYDELREHYKQQGQNVFESFATSVNGQRERIRAWLGLLPPEKRGNLSTRSIADAFRKTLGDIPDAREVEFTSTLSGEGARRLSIALYSKNPENLTQAVEYLKKKLRTYSALYAVRDSNQNAKKELRFTLKPGAESLGITLSDVIKQVRYAFYGYEVQRLPRGGEDVRVMLRYPKENRQSLDSLRNLRIRTGDGREIPLYAVADVKFTPGMHYIDRRERQRSVRVRADVIGDARNEIMQELNETFFPEMKRRFPDVTRSLLGDAQAQQDFLKEVVMLMFIMLGAMYILLAVAFKSYFQPVLIMSAIPFAFAGAVFGLLITGQPMALFSFFGIGAAAGVVVNDNLVLLDFVARLRKNGVGAFQALVDAGVARFRPILLTSLTTFIGVMPMMAERSTQAQFLKPMVVSLAFAVLFAFFLTLFFVPALYAIGVDVARLYRWAWTGKKPEFPGAHYDDSLEHMEQDIEAASREEA